MSLITLISTRGQENVERNMSSTAGGANVGPAVVEETRGSVGIDGAEQCALTPHAPDAACAPRGVRHPGFNVDGAVDGSMGKPPRRCTASRQKGL